MSKEAAAAFIQKLQTDEAFRKRILAVKEVGPRMDLIKTEGFDCTAAELDAASGELSQNALDQIAGGVGGDVMQSDKHMDGELVRDSGCGNSWGPPFGNSWGNSWGTR